MEILHSIADLAQLDGPLFLAVGAFDGVHLGHQAVIGRTVEAARDRGIRSVATTFDRHPREVLTHGHEPRLLTTLERKISLIEALGVDILLVLQFTLEFSKTSPRDFVERFLVESVHAAHVVLGANFRFGHRAQGDLAYLHVHPDAHPDAVAGPGTSAGPEVTFHVDVPSDGTYRLFLDFQHAGRVHTAEFTAATDSHAADHAGTPGGDSHDDHD